MGQDQPAALGTGLQDIVTHLGLRVEGAGEVQGLTVRYLCQLTERGLSNTAYRQDRSRVLVPGRLSGEGYPCRIFWEEMPCGDFLPGRAEAQVRGGCPVWKAQEKNQGSASWKTGSPGGSEPTQSQEGEGSAEIQQYGRREGEIPLSLPGPSQRQSGSQTTDHRM